MSDQKDLTTLLAELDARPPLPEHACPWPTLEQIANHRVELPTCDELDGILDAAQWAVETLPKLRALVENRFEYRDCSASYVLDKIAALLPKEE